MGISVRISIVLSLIAIGGAAWTLQRALSLSPTFLFNVLLISGAGGALLLGLAGKYLKSCSFGPANRVTLVRGGLTAMLFAIVAEAPTAATAWCAVLTSTMALALDGVDGWLARSRDDVSDFGARFDMETDALLILGVSILVWQFDKAGPWILAAGLMRYVFVALSGVLPWMKRALPRSRRRKTIFVTQAVSLIFCLVPLVGRPASDGVALAGLALLTGSFLVDIVWLMRARPVLGSAGERDYLTVDYGGE